MSTDRESPSFYVEYEKELRHATRLDNVYFMTNAVGAGLVMGTTVGLVLGIGLGIPAAIGTGTILGVIIGGLIGAFILWVKRHRPSIE
jgi:hypothetical protein